MKMLRIISVTLLGLLLVDQCRCSCITDGDTEKGSNATLSTLSDAILEYTLKQYKSMVTNERKSSDNIFTSPYSIWSALTLLYLGSKGESSNQLNTLLGLEGIKKSAVEQTNDVLKQTLKSDNGSTFLVANKLAVDRNANLRKCVADNPSFEVETVDFSRAPEKERVQLNEWVKEKTQKKIKDLLPRGSVDASTVMVILNAVYFKGSWKSKFKLNLTAPMDFESLNGEIKKVDMMFQRSAILYNAYNDLGVQAVDLPYSDGKYSMTVMLPEQGKSVDELVLNLDSNKLRSLYKGFYKKTIYLWLPKFKIKSSYNLVETLKKLGVNKMFQSIDMSGFLNSSVPLAVSAVFHKAFVEVNEEGTEAAAATGIITTKTFVIIQPTIMKVNRPFVFILREVKTNTIMFMGVVRKL